MRHGQSLTLENLVENTMMILRLNPVQCAKQEAERLITDVKTPIM